MGIFKGIAWFVTAGAVRPTTTRERSRMYQRRANRLLEEQLYVMQSPPQQQFTEVPSDALTEITRPSVPNEVPNSHSHPVQTSSSKRKAQRNFNRRWRRTKRLKRRQTKQLKRRQASEDRRLMQENQVIVEQHGIKNAAVLRLVLEDNRVMEHYKDLVLQHGFTDASQVRAHLQEQALEKSRIQQLEIEQAQRAKDRQQQADAEARRTLRVLAIKMQQFGLVVQKCLNPEQGVEISEEELRAAFESIRSSLNEHQELSPNGIAKYQKTISELSAMVAEKTGYESL